MPTRDEVLTAIAAIDDNGNNTAAEMRTVLNLLLEHGEENPTTGGGGLDLETFDITEERLIAVDTTEAEGINLGFSFRGFRNFHGNLTFNLNFDKIDRERNFKFQIKDETIKILEELGIKTNGPRLAFAVPLISKDSDSHFPCIMHIGVDNDKLLTMDINYMFDDVEGLKSIATSIHFHLPGNAND